MDYAKYVDVALSLLELAVQICYMYQIVTRTGVVSWDCVCLNAMTNLILLATRSMNKMSWWCVVRYWMFSVLPTIVVLLLKYPSRNAYYMPYYLRWPVLLAGSAMLSWTVAEFPWSMPWFHFGAYTDVFSGMPQGYIIVKSGGTTDNLTVGMFFLLFLNRTISGLWYTVEGDEWLDPHVMASWFYLCLMCIPLVRFYVKRGRMPNSINDVYDLV